MNATVEQLWADVLPDVKNAVTGVGVWSALNNCKAIAYEDNNFVVGLPPEVSDLAGHLRLHQTKTLIERIISSKLGEVIHLRVIDGVTKDDWEGVKRRDAQALAMQQQAMQRQREEVKARTNWDTVFDQISRQYATLPNKSLPQVRGKFAMMCIDLVVESLKVLPVTDDHGERNLARCIDRIATYADLPSTYVALLIEQKSGR